MSLIKCQSCQCKIAQSAKSCPKCGAINDFMHSEIKRFLAEKEKVEVPALFGYRYLHDRTTLTFSYIKPSIHKPWLNFGKAALLGLVISIFNIVKWWAVLNSPGAFLYVFQFALSLLGGVCFVYATIGFAAWMILTFMDANIDKPDKYLKIDFCSGSPKWETNDQEFWKSPIEFFKLQSNKKSAA